MIKHNRTIKILFTSIGRRVELVQQFYAAAKQLNIPLQIIGADISSSAPALAFCDKTAIVPRIKDAAYIPELLRICREQQVDALIPTIDTDLYLLSCEKERFAEIGTMVFISTPEKIAVCRDKRHTAAYFRSVGLASPESVDAVEKYQSGFPAFIKPFDGSSSIGANRADTLEQLHQFASQLSGYVVQPFVAGTEYTVDVFCDQNGNPIYITPRIRQAVRAGEVLKTRIHHEPSILQEVLQLIADFKPCGAITVQLIRDELSGVNHYIEINPRFGGGAPLSAKAGADAAAAMLRLLSGDKLTYQPNAAAEGAVYSRFDQCICVDKGATRQIKAVIFDLDDTLYSEKEYVRSGYSQVATQLPQIENAEEKLWNAFLDGKPAIDHVLYEEGIYSEEQKEACLCAYRYQAPEIKLFEGVHDMLAALRNAGIKIGIITDGRPEGQRAKIKALGLEELVDSVVVTDELGGVAFRKPCDIAFRIMQRRMNVPFENMIYVGDNAAKDFQAPKQLGMMSLHLYNPDGIYATNDADADLHAATIEELCCVLLDRL